MEQFGCILYLAKLLKKTKFQMMKNSFIMEQ